MAGEIQLPYVTGRTVYAVIRSTAGEIYNTVGGVFETFTAGNWADYDVAMTEQSTSAYYVGNFPALTPGVYHVESHERLTGSPLITDPTIGEGELEWNGAAVMQIVKLADNVTHGGSAALLQLERIVVTSLTADEPAVKLQGQGTGAGLRSSGGLFGNGIEGVGTAPGGSGFHGSGGVGMALVGSVSNGLAITGPRGISVTSSNGSTLRLVPTGGHGLEVVAPVGTDLHGIFVTGGTLGTSDGVRIDAGTGGVDVRADITGNITGTVTSLTSVANIVAGVLAGGDVDGFTLEETLKLCLAALAGKLAGAATTSITIRAADDSKTRITATVDSNGNRSAITLDAAG